jgi:hypothetical protein
VNLLIAKSMVADLHGRRLRQLLLRAVQIGPSGYRYSASEELFISIE